MACISRFAAAISSGETELALLTIRVNRIGEMDFGNFVIGEKWCSEKWVFGTVVSGNCPGTFTGAIII